jgi:hypothetical protein
MAWKPASRPASASPASSTNRCSASA